MDNSPLRTIIVPAIFVSSVTFSALTLPFALIQSEPLDIELPPFFNGEVQPMFDGEHNDRAISYVGFAIVASVGAGVASVEVIRRRIRNLPQPEAPSQNRPGFSSKEAQLELTRPIEQETAVDGILAEDSFNSQSLSESPAIDADGSLNFAALVQAFDTVQQVEHLPMYEPSSHAILSTNGLPDDTSAQSKLSQLSQCTLQRSDSESSEILESSERHQTYRIQAPGLQQSLLVIVIKDQYYSLFKAEKTREKALEIIAKLGQPANKMIVTKTKRSYAIWDLMPGTSSIICN